MRYRIIKPDWANKPESEGGIPGEKSLDFSDVSPEFLKEKNDLGYGIYYFPNYPSKPLDHPYTAGRDIDVFKYVYVDMDLKDGHYTSKDVFIEALTAFVCPPNKIVDSGNGVHAYWEVLDLNREQFVTLNLRLIKQFKTDPSIWTVLRCMRLEGYNNTKKRDEPKFVRAQILETKQYTIEELDKNLPSITEEDQKRATSHIRGLDGLRAVADLEDLEMDKLPEKFVKLLETDDKIRELFYCEDEESDRSKQAYILTQRLYEKDYDSREAFQIIMQTPKARAHAKGPEYFTNTLVPKVFDERTMYKVPSVAQMIRENKHEVRRGKEAKGPDYFDCLEKGWRSQQCLGLIGGTGIGKSTVSLDIFRGMIDNNPDSKDIYVYFNLEMPSYEIIEKWTALTGGDPKLAERLYVVSNEDEQGNPLHISLQHIFWYCRDISKMTGRKIASICIDHIAVINPSVDITKKPDFGLRGEMEGSYGDLRNVSPRKMPQLLKELAKQLDCFVIIQSQTTKAKGGDGDTPLPVHAAYGASQFEHYMDFIMTLWQPIRKVHHKTSLRIMAWQYCKIRNKSKGDKTDTYDPAVLGVEMSTGKLYWISESEEEEFQVLLKEANLLRIKAEKKNEIDYKSSAGLKKLRVVK